jgi:hypothetical protein
VEQKIIKFYELALHMGIMKVGVQTNGIFIFAMKDVCTIG